MGDNFIGECWMIILHKFDHNFMARIILRFTHINTFAVIKPNLASFLTYREEDIFKCRLPSGGYVPLKCAAPVFLCDEK